MDHDRRSQALLKIKNENILLGSGEWEKNLQLPHNASANHNTVDSYENAPAMQVAHGFEVINMLDGL
jgi:phosphoribosylglycinamide formyltransferase 2